MTQSPENPVPGPELEWEDPEEPRQAAPYQEPLDDLQDDPPHTPRSYARMLVRAGAGAISWARGQVVHRSRSWTGMCLMFVRMSFNVGSRYPSAENAWGHTERRHTSWPPPPGVPVWWTNGRFGHVVLSAGNGWCYSTDFLRTGRVDKVRINTITSAWGQHYRGWSEDINGIHVYRSLATAIKPRVNLNNVIRATTNSRNLKQGIRLKKAVADEVGKGSMVMSNGTLGQGFRDQYKLVQQKYLRAAGQRVTGVSADGIPGAGSLGWLARRHGFEVV